MSKPRPFVPTEADRQRVADIIRRREAAGLTQGHLAKQAGVSTRTMQRYEKLKRPIPLQTLERIELALSGIRRPATPPHNGATHLPPALDAAIARRASELSYAQVQDLIRLSATLPFTPTEAQWDAIIDIALNRRALP